MPKVMAEGSNKDLDFQPGPRGHVFLLYSAFSDCSRKPGSSADGARTLGVMMIQQLQICQVNTAFGT